MRSEELNASEFLRQRLEFYRKSLRLPEVGVLSFCMIETLQFTRSKMTEEETGYNQRESLFHAHRLSGQPIV